MRVIREDTRESSESDCSASDRWSRYAFMDRFEMYWVWATYGYWVMSVWTFGELHWAATEKGMVSIDSRLGLVSFQGSLLGSYPGLRSFIDFVLSYLHPILLKQQMCVMKMKKGPNLI